MKEKLYLRPVTIGDAELLFEWVNESDVRHNSFNSAQISWDEHKSWMERVLSDNNILLYILMEDDHPVGQVRLAYCGKWHVSYSIALAYRGQGYGKILLQLVENELISRGHIGEVLYAEVKIDNVASQRIFIGLDYSKIEGQRNDALTYEKSVSSNLYKIYAPMSTGGGTALILSNNVNSIPLLEWLGKKVDVLYYSGRLNDSMLDKIKPKLVISYNYRYIIKREMIKAVQGDVINLHISLLPWNRGSSPNIWSFIDDTPKGVTIHILDEGLDTGDILLQKELFFDEKKETLASSYQKLNDEIVKLLQNNWQYIWDKNWQPYPQSKGGSSHTMKDFTDFLQGRTFSYDMTIADFRREFRR